MREWLKNLRVEHSFTQQDVADKLGITRQYYSYIECGERQKKMDITFVSKISDIFGISIQAIIDFEDELALKYANAETS